MTAKVTVAGGGLAGITVALRLAERGHQVKLYESKPALGGNIGVARSSAAACSSTCTRTCT